MRRILNQVVLTAFCLTACTLAAEMFTEDFSSATLQNTENGYLGGWYGSNIAFGQWYGLGTVVSIDSGVITVVDDTPSYRSAGVILDPGLFSGGAQALVLSFDVVSVTLFPDGAGELGDTHNAEVKIWSAEGYDLSGDSGDAVYANSLGGTLSPQGDASVQFLTSAQITEPVTGYTMEFEYDGFSCIGLFFGANRDNWPDIEVTYDNISISPVPEPTTGALIGLLLAGAAGTGMGRRRSGC